MISEHLCFSPPQDRNVKLWRYMDLPKFIHLLQTKSLYFSRASRLGDPFEGSNSLANHALDVDTLRDLQFSSVVLTNGPVMTDDQVRSILEHESNAAKENVDKYFVSCWHMNEHESAAMWRIYAQSKDAVCIQTTFSKLADALPSVAFAGIVDYKNYDTEIITIGNIFHRIMHKMKQYEYEREVRAVLWEALGEDGAEEIIRKRMNAFGLYVDIDLNKLIESVTISPTATPWFVDVVNNSLEIYGLSVKAHASRLSKEPVF